MPPTVFRSDGADLGRLGALLPLLDRKLDPLAFGQLTVALNIDVGLVDEHVGRTVLGRDEAETLGRVEPLHSTCSHLLALSVCLSICLEKKGKRYRIGVPERHAGDSALG